MRRLTDALPTLRDPAAAPMPALLPAPRGPEPRQLPRPGAQAKPADAFDVASLRSALLKQRHAPAETNRPAAPEEAAAQAQAQAQTQGLPKAAPRQASPIPTFDGPPKENVEGRIKAAVAAAKAEADKDKAAAVELARKVEREVAARALTDARAAWVETEAAALAARVADAFEALHVKLSDAFGRVLAPIVEAAVREAAVRRFAETLDDLAGPAAAAPVLTVAGPQDLVDALARRLPGGGVTCAPAARPDLVAEIGDTRLETTLAAFADVIAAAVLPTPAPLPAPIVAAAPAEPTAEASDV